MQQLLLNSWQFFPRYIWNIHQGFAILIVRRGRNRKWLGSLTVSNRQKCLSAPRRGPRISQTFCVDDFTSNSLLFKGFHQPWSSPPWAEWTPIFTSPAYSCQHPGSGICPTFVRSRVPQLGWPEAAGAGALAGPGRKARWMGWRRSHTKQLRQKYIHCSTVPRTANLVPPCQGLSY